MTRHGGPGQNLACAGPEDLRTMPVEKVARVVSKAATTARLLTRYNVGFWTNFGPLGRYLAGHRIVDWWMSREIPHDRERG